VVRHGVTAAIQTPADLKTTKILIDIKGQVK